MEYLATTLIAKFVDFEGQINLALFHLRFLLTLVAIIGTFTILMT